MNFVKLITILILTTISLSIYVQDFNGGVLGGINATQVFGDQWSGPNKAGLYLGAFVNRYFSNRSSVQMELDYIQKGSRKNPDASTGNYSTYLLRLNYIELPVLYKYDFAEKGTLETGLSLGVLVHSYEEADGSTEVSGEDFSSVDFSFNLGAYYTVVKNLRINLRLAHSILPIRPHASGQTYGLNQGQYNQSITFILHYIIPGLSR
ncbi:MAG: PorT family protein [Bacteroidales bacterium]|nr:PorT family protein [Bacteroidales bacterium]